MTTPHPTDALPLPEPFMAMCRDTVPHIYDAWANQLRAARREGYELAMSMRANEIDGKNFEDAIEAEIKFVDALDLMELPSALSSLPDAGAIRGYARFVRRHAVLAVLKSGRFIPALASQPAQEQAISKAQEGREQTTAQGKINAELDTDSNTSESQQRRHMAGSLEVGQLVGDRQDSRSGDIEPQGEKSLERWLCGILKPLAEDIAKNCSTVPQLVIAPLIWGISDLLKSGALCTSQPAKSDEKQQQAGAAEVSDERIESLWRFFADTSHVIRIERFQFDQLVRGIAKLLPERVSDEQIEAAAKIVAERFDYPWAHMPEEGRNHMRDTARAVLALSQGGK